MRLKFCEKRAKKGTLKTQITILVLNQSPISAVFPIVRFTEDQKTALIGESLYINAPKGGITVQSVLMLLAQFSKKKFS